jgi:serine/threonine protein kinase
MNIESVLDIFFYVKRQYDNYKSNAEENSLIIRRVKVLEDPLLKIQSKELEISASSIDTLKDVLDFVKDFLHEYNTTSMWKSVMIAVRSGKYAADFHKCNVMIDRALDAVNLSLNISSKVRRQQDSEAIKEFITNLCSHVITEIRAHGSVGNEEEKQRCEEILLEVKALSAERESIMKTFLETLGHKSFEFSPVEKADFVAMHEEVEDLINAGIDILAASIDDLKDQIDVLRAVVEGNALNSEKQIILREQLSKLYRQVVSTEISIGDKTTSKLGEGAFGQVYEASWNDRPVAVKVFTPDTNHPDDIVKMKKDVEREAFILEEMKDPLVLRAYGIVRVDERVLWLVMDKAKYGSVMSYLCMYPSLDQIPLFLLFGIMKDIGAAVAHLHSHGVTHKDIKAENILLHNSPYEFCVKLCDFGLAKQESLSGDTALLPMQSKTGAGTQPFMAPELKDPTSAKGRHSSNASDVFAVCVTFLQILIRQTPEDSMFGYQSKIHSTLMAYFTNHTLRVNHQKFYGSDGGVSSALNRLMQILYEGLSLEPVPSNLDLSRISEIPEIYYQPRFDPRKRPSAKDLTLRLSDILDSYLGGDGRKEFTKLSFPMKGDSAIAKNQRLVKQFVSAFDEGTDVDYESIGGISNSTSSLKIGGGSLPPTPPLSSSSTFPSMRDQNKEMDDKLVNCSTDLKVQKTDGFDSSIGCCTSPWFRLNCVKGGGKKCEKCGYYFCRYHFPVNNWGLLGGHVC